jgi:Flp pilus assembly protein TadD
MLSVKLSVCICKIPRNITSNLGTKQGRYVSRSSLYNNGQSASGISCLGGRVELRAGLCEIRLRRENYCLLSRIKTQSLIVHRSIG